MTRTAATIAGFALVLAASRQAQFRSSVDVVQLTVAVVNGKKVVADLAAKDFEVLDNGVKQTVLSVTRELLPIDVTMVIDTSESLSPALQTAIVSAANAIRARLKPEDRLSLVTFNQRIQEQLALGPPASAGTIGLGRVAGQTALNDVIGVVLAVRPVADRRQMAIVFTDGYDSTSLLTEADVIGLAGRSNTSMFLVSRAAIGSNVGASLALSSALASWSPATAGGPRQPVDFFRQIAAATGGLAQIVPTFTVTQTENATTFRSTSNLLDEPFLAALDDFRSSYVLRYDLTGVPRPGWHNVAVKVTRPGNKYTVRTRSGYAGG